MFCPNCGQLNDDNANFCCACNTALNGEAQPQAAVVQPPVTPEPQYQQPVYQQPVYQQPYAPANAVKKPNNAKLPFIISLIGAVLVIISIFCPILTVKSGLAAFAPDDQENISIVKYTELEMEDDEEEGLVYVGMLAVLAVGAILALSFSIAKKGVMVIISAILVALPYILWVVDISDKNLTEYAYDYGVAFYLFIVSIILLIVGGIWLLAAKSSAKKQQYAPNPYA